MKKLLLAIIGLSILFIFTNITFAQQRGGQGHNNQGQSYNHQGQGHNNQGHGPIYKGHPNSYNDYHKYNGHQFRPYRGPMHPNYRYNGHWNSWSNWNYYYSRHPEYYRYGHYIRHHDRLFFFFNNGITAFSFSIED